MRDRQTDRDQTKTGNQNYQSVLKNWGGGGGGGNKGGEVSLIYAPLCQGTDLKVVSKKYKNIFI